MSSIAGEGRTPKDGLQVPGMNPSDKTEHIAIHAVECVQCHEHSDPGDEAEAYRWQGAHYDETDHVMYWHYKLERSRARIVHPSRDHW
jgi:hypothetical protein